MQEKVSAQYKNEIEMAKAQRDYELKKAAYDVEVNTKKAESEMAYQLQVSFKTSSSRANCLKFDISLLCCGNCVCLGRAQHVHTFSYDRLAEFVLVGPIQVVDDA